MKHPAYNLRPNKAVDRSLLVERIRELEGVGLLNARNSSYYGFGGPFLDDLRILSEAFPLMSFHSLEGNKQTYLRQKFHRFSPFLQLYPHTVDDFLASENMKNSDHLIWWLDFTGFCINDLKDVTSLANSLSPGDFLRVTANANVTYDFSELENTFGVDRCREVAADLKKEFRVTYEDYLDEECQLRAIFDDSTYPELCVRMILNALKKRDNSKATRAWHLGTRIYRDGAQMVTCEFYFTKRNCDKNPIGHNYLKSIEDEVLKTESINVPNLSIKERLHLEGCLPRDPNCITDFSQGLGYKIEKSKSNHESSMKQYAKYHKHYPMLGRVSQ